VHFPRLSDWLIYVVIIVAVVVVAIARRERSDAPPPPPPPAGEGLPLGPASPFDPSVIVEAPATPEPGSGTAFSIDERGGLDHRPSRRGRLQARRRGCR
jgi:hypothetical protein